MKKHREEDILRYLEVHEFLATEEAIRLFEASPATIRRAFTRLAERYAVRRVRGGVRRLPPEANASIPFAMRERWLTEEKVLLARHALRFAPENGAVFLHSGSTVLELAKCVKAGTIITDCLYIANVLMRRFPSGGADVILSGGALDLKAGSLAGSRAERNIREYRADVAFFSARGLDGEGVLDTNDALAAVSRAMIESAQCSVMLADHRKFQPFGLSRLVPWDKVDILVTTDHPANRVRFERIRQRGVRVELVPPPPAKAEERHC